MVRHRLLTISGFLSIVKLVDRDRFLVSVAYPLCFYDPLFQQHSILKQTSTIFHILIHYSFPYTFHIGNSIKVKACLSPSNPKCSSSFSSSSSWLCFLAPVSQTSIKLENSLATAIDFPEFPGCKDKKCPEGKSCVPVITGIG